MTVTCQSSRSAEPGVKLQSVMSQRCRFGHPFAGRQIKLLHSSEIKIIGGKVLRSPPRRQSNFCLKQLWLDGGDYRYRDVILQGENIRQVTLEPVRPNVRTCHCINQLPCDPDFTRRLAHRPLKNIAHAKSASDLPYVDGFSFERKARIASDDEQPFEPRERRDDFFDHPVGKVLLLGITGHVLERQDGDGSLVRQRRRALTVSNTQRGSLLRFTRRTYLIDPDGLLDVLHLLNTKVHEGHRQDLAYLIVRRPGDTYASGVRQCLQPSGNVHTVSKEVPSTHHHVADVDTDAEANAAIWCETGVRFRQGSLRLHRALHCFNGAPELRKDAVARRVRYAAPVFPNDPVEDCAPFG